MMDSAAAGLAYWIKNRETDLAHARRVIEVVRAHREFPQACPILSTGREAAKSQKMIHSAIECIRIDNRQIQREAELLSLCTEHLYVDHCTCVPTF